mmetsp:Transcript_53755/g.86892  ORF Transcript_53755/g.86892 Transcript_53755/m.86892 type:complete len:255 (+) Transcript_53755:157-921(+)
MAPAAAMLTAAEGSRFSIVHVARALQKVVHRKESLEGFTVDAQQVGSALADNARSTRLVLDESKLTEVVARVVAHDLHAILVGEAISFLDDVELRPDLTLADDSLPVGEDLHTESVCEVGALVRIHGGQKWYLGQEGVIARALLLRSLSHDVIEGVAVQLPKNGSLLGHHRGRPWAVVEERELAEHISGSAGLHRLLGAIRQFDQTVKLARLNDEQEVAIIALVDDASLSRCIDLLHGPQANVDVVGIQAGKEE